MATELVSEKRLGELAHEALFRPGGLASADANLSTELYGLEVARAALAELEVGLVYELGDELLEVTLFACEVEKRAILVRAKP